MITVRRVDQYDTFARHLVVDVAGVKIDLSAIATLDEGRDQKLLGVGINWGKRFSSVWVGLVKDYQIDGTSRGWRPHFRAFSHIWKSVK